MVVITKATGRGQWGHTPNMVAMLSTTERCGILIALTLRILKYVNAFSQSLVRNNLRGYPGSESAEPEIFFFEEILTQQQLTPFVTAQMKPIKMDEIRADGTIHTPDYTDGKAFIEAWKTDNPVDYEAKKEEWRVYLEAIGEIQTPEAPDKAAEPYHFESNIRQQAREDAMAHLVDDARTPKSWIGRVFKR